MPKRTAPLLVLFLLGCPKSESDAEIFRFTQEVRLPAPKSTVPIEVLAPTRRIRLRSLKVASQVEGTRASTELTIALSEATPPGSRLSLLLPRNARIRRLAAHTGERWREASTKPVEKSDLPLIPVTRAEPRFAPELPPSTDELVVAYTEELSRAHRVALLGLGELDSFQAEVTTSTGALRLNEQRWTPDRDLEVRLPVRSEVRHEGEPRKIDALLVALDSSASSAKDWERRIELARALTEALGNGSGPTKKIHLGTFDQTYEVVYQGEIGKLSPDTWERLRQWRAVGASNYALMLGTLSAGRLLRVVAHDFSRVLVIGDGIATTGPRDQETLGAATKKLSQIGVKRVDVIALGDARDEALLRTLVSASPSEPGALIDGELKVEEIARRLAFSAPPLPGPQTETSTETPAFYARAPRTAGAPLPHKPALSRAPPPETRREALPATLSWYDRAPFDPNPVISLGEIFAAMNETTRAARAFGSLVDLYPRDPDMLQLAGMRLDGMREESAIRVALSAFERAALLAPERASSHRLLAYALMKAHQEELAFEVIERALKRLPVGPPQRILREDAAILAAAWVRKEPQRRQEIATRLIPFGMTLANQPSLSFALYWNADVDVDLRLFDRDQRAVPLEGDVAGYGPEVAIIRAEPRHRAYPYRAEAHVFGRAPLGMTAGKLEIIDHDGNGGLRFASRTFVLTEESGIVDLGEVTKPFGKGGGGR